MKATVINTPKELKNFVQKIRKYITNINDVQFNETYPMMEISNNHALYYDAEKQGYKPLYAPFKIEICEG